MFRPMRRTKQQLELEECARILKSSTSGVLATAGAEGYPYAVPLSYVYLPEGASPHGAMPLGSIIFHCSPRGHKIEALEANPKASFCVISQDVPIPEEFATHYASVIAFGTVRFVDDPSEKRQLLTALGAKYSPGLDNEAQEEIDRFLKATCVASLDIEHLSGKQARALAEH